MFGETNGVALGYRSIELALWPAAASPSCKLEFYSEGEERSEKWR